MLGGDDDPDRQRGKVLLQPVGNLPREPLLRLRPALDVGGYVPADTDNGDVILRNCPFRSVAQEHAQLVCTLNRAVIRGALEETGDDPDRAELDPYDGRCCIVIHPEARP